MGHNFKAIYKGMNTPASFCNINLVIAYPPRAANEGGKEGGEMRVGFGHR